MLCQHPVYTLSWFLCADQKNFHVRRSCVKCKAFLKWEPQTEQVLELLGPKPEATAQRAKDDGATLFGDL